jgi:coenzyme F420-reducing hydrogenase delta subunit/NAD-dependent dihydropyrimidine dehydrogenase PreA subunit
MPVDTGVAPAPPEPGDARNRRAMQTSRSAAAAPPPDASPFAPEVRGEAALRRFERAFLRLDRALAQLVPEALNPFLQTGAVALTCLAVATVTGVVLLLWYSPSLHHAWESVDAMTAQPLGAGLLRSLHRYSSDAAMFFVLVHALRLFFERRFTGARWLAWVTGLAAVALLWFVGWTGYWLVWDERAKHVAVGTARALDAVPIFADPMGRSFLTDAGVNSLLFFVVFFFHMLVPLALGIALWLHLARIARPRFLTRTPMTAWVLASLTLLSLAYPATSAPPARMTALGGQFGMDWWYLLPLVVSDRLSGGALWSTLLVAGTALGAMPWWLGAPRRPAARVEPVRCNACAQCYQDCPFEAISMVPRTEGRLRYETQAEVDPSKCVGCGICAGSCDSIGVGLDAFTVPDQRERLEAWIADAVAAGEAPHVAFACVESAGGALDVDAQTGRCAELPGYRVLQVPCAGWVHMLSIERALRRGAAGALVIGCGPGACRQREGLRWTELRLDGSRPPALRAEKVERGRIRLLALDRTSTRELVREALAARAGAAEPARTPLFGLARAGFGAALLAVLVAVLVGVPSDLGYGAPRPSGSELVVTFKHPGRTGEECRAIAPEERAKLPAHMRRDRICERRRADVRLRVLLDGKLAARGSYPPEGVWGDGNSVAVVRIPVAPGPHAVSVAIGDSLAEDEWTWRDERTLEFSSDARRVVSFDRLAGFGWH